MLTYYMTYMYDMYTGMTYIVDCTLYIVPGSIFFLRIFTSMLCVSTVVHV